MIFVRIFGWREDMNLLEYWVEIFVGIFSWREDMSRERKQHQAQIVSATFSYSMVTCLAVWS